MSGGARPDNLTTEQRAASPWAGLAGEHLRRTLKTKSSSLNTNEVRERSVGDIKIILVLNSVPDTEELIIRKIYSSFSPLGNKNDWIIVENPELKIMQLKDLV